VGRAASTLVLAGLLGSGCGGDVQGCDLERIEGLPARAVDVVTGGYHLCALLEDGTAWCRGRDYGQRGLGPATLGASRLRGCLP
jgi:hypothetical protein